MNIFQSHQRDIPEQKDEEEKDQTSENQKPDEDSFFRSTLQGNPPKNADCGMQNAELFSLPISKYELVINLI
jgi:hypothetical protein